MEAHFLTPIRAEKLTGKRWKLTDRLVYYSALLDATICAPAGFVTDFASVPRLPIAYWLFGGKADSPAGIHDLLYRWPFVSRIMADRVFNEAMRVEGKTIFTRWPMYAGVVVGGWLSFKNMPGSLDYRICRDCQWETGPACAECDNYYPQWSGLYKQGYWPDMKEDSEL